MIRTVKWIFSQVPQLEVGVRVLYWKYPAVNSLIKRVTRKSAKGAVTAACLVDREKPITLPALSEAIREHGVARGDILIVHSSMQSLAPTGATPGEIIDLLLDVVGDDGTLVMPAIPKYREAPIGTERISQDLSQSVWTYDVQRTPPWTGALPHKLMKRPGAVRSRFPLNTVVAFGQHARAMMAHELGTPDSTPCGPNSAWAYCAKHNAKILMLGVDLAHSLTMIHVAEDCQEDNWPIAGWYRSRQFLVKYQGSEMLVNVRERHPKWAMYYGERKLNADLLHSGVARETRLESLPIISLESRALLRFLGDRRSRGYPYFLWSMSQ
ncbi:AAC(3) family N-acetyltransferase [Variovorax sp. dw_308]|uniref:AAC(3) family N-acetyltransferase n=1 Tax=Variovorax sp. dw_308 TaxID=2721546 RepID=UPI001C488551|nr:AAC(3) family N-acetyltransferase [Variovorax sp. dw_308]